MRLCRSFLLRHSLIAFCIDILKIDAPIPTLFLFLPLILLPYPAFANPELRTFALDIIPIFTILNRWWLKKKTTLVGFDFNFITIPNTEKNFFLPLSFVIILLKNISTSRKIVLNLQTINYVIRDEKVNFIDLVRIDIVF